MNPNKLSIIVLLISFLVFVKSATSKGEINCVYEIESASESTKILGDNFLPESNIIIYIDGEEQKFTKKYLFPSIGSYEIKFELTDEINMDFMFEDVTALTRVEMFSENNLKITRFESTFERCIYLLSFTMKGFDTSSAASMKRMFYQTSSLDKVDLSEFNTESVLDMSSMFESSNIFSLDLNNFNTKRVKNMNSMFKWCQNLVLLRVSNFDTSSVTDMSNMFLWVNNLEKLDVSKWDTSEVIDMSYMFDYCSSLTSLDVSNFDTSNVVNMNNMFASLIKLTSLDVSKFKTSNVVNMDKMFSQIKNY